MPDAAAVTMLDMAQFDETVEEIKTRDGVAYIRAQDDIADKIITIKNGIGIAGICIISILIIIALVIVSNTIRVTMYNRKLEISIMKAVGATNSFVRVPFIVEGIVFGVISATITTGALYFIYNFLISQLTGGMFNAVKFEDVVWFMYGGFCILGIFAGVVGSMFSMGKYLKKEGSEFSAL